MDREFEEIKKIISVHYEALVGHAQEQIEKFDWTIQRVGFKSKYSDSIRDKLLKDIRLLKFQEFEIDGDPFGEDTEFANMLLNGSREYAIKALQYNAFGIRKNKALLNDLSQIAIQKTVDFLGFDKTFDLLLNIYCCEGCDIEKQEQIIESVLERGIDRQQATIYERERYFLFKELKETDLTFEQKNTFLDLLHSKRAVITEVIKIDERYHHPVILEKFLEKTKRLYENSIFEHEKNKSLPLMEKINGILSTLEIQIQTRLQVQNQMRTDIEAKSLQLKKLNHIKRLRNDISSWLMRNRIRYGSLCSYGTSQERL